MRGQNRCRAKLRRTNLRGKIGCQCKTVPQHWAKKVSEYPKAPALFDAAPISWSFLPILLYISSSKIQGWRDSETLPKSLCSQHSTVNWGTCLISLSSPSPYFHCFCSYSYWQGCHGTAHLIIFTCCLIVNVYIVYV